MQTFTIGNITFQYYLNNPAKRTEAQGQLWASCAACGRRERVARAVQHAAVARMWADDYVHGPYRHTCPPSRPTTTEERRDPMESTTHFPQDWNLPPLSHPVNALFDREALLERLDREDWRSWVPVGLPCAKKEAERFFAANPEARAFVTPVWCGDGSVRLVRIGPRGGRRVLWTFRQAV